MRCRRLLPLDSSLIGGAVHAPAPVLAELPALLGSLPASRLLLAMRHFLATTAILRSRVHCHGVLPAVSVHL